MNLYLTTFALTQAQLDDYIIRLEEAERKIQAAEAKIAEKDQRITEVERLLGCMGKVKHRAAARPHKWRNLRLVSTPTRAFLVIMVLINLM